MNPCEPIDTTNTNINYQLKFMDGQVGFGNFHYIIFKLCAQLSLLYLSLYVQRYLLFWFSKKHRLYYFIST